MNIWWIRHAPIEHTGRYTGHTDLPALIPEGFGTPILPLLPTDATHYASPLARAVQTAETLRLTPFTLAPELAEQDFGAWENRYYHEVWEEGANALDWSQPEHITPPDGESFADVCLRVAAWIEARQEKRIIAVTHAGVIRAALKQALGLSHTEALALIPDCGGVSHIEYGASGTVAHYINRHGT